MKVLIYGAKGWIGSKVLQLLKKESIDTIESKCRANLEYDVEQELVKVQPSHVMCFIGRTHGKIGDNVFSTIDYLEQPNKLYENIRDNLYGPTVLAFLCQKYSIHLTYIGTGCIYKYDDQHPFTEINGFTEYDRPNFFGSSYSVMKGFTDLIMRFFKDNVLDVRLRMPITDEHNPRNLITKLVKYEKICSIPNSMTVLDDLLPIMIDMAKKGITGSVNLVNPGLISHNEILEMYRDIMDPTFTWKNFTVEEQDKVLAAERSNNFLDTTLLESMYKVENIKESVKSTMIRMKNKPTQEY